MESIFSFPYLLGEWGAENVQGSEYNYKLGKEKSGIVNPMDLIIGPGYLYAVIYSHQIYWSFLMIYLSLSIKAYSSLGAITWQAMPFERVRHVNLILNFPTSHYKPGVNPPSFHEYDFPFSFWSSFACWEILSEIPTSPNQTHSSEDWTQTRHQETFLISLAGRYPPPLHSSHRSVSHLF